MGEVITYTGSVPSGNKKLSQPVLTMIYSDNDNDKGHNGLKVFTTWEANIQILLVNKNDEQSCTNKHTYHSCGQK